MRALLLVDIQVDFAEAFGGLSVPEGSATVSMVNKLRLEHEWGLVVVALDWHPDGHMSFVSSNPGHAAFSTLGSQTLWPEHCVQDSLGACAHPQLVTEVSDVVVVAGTRPTCDSYSAARDNDKRSVTPLIELLRARGVEEVWVCGLAFEYAVLYSALDCKALLGVDVVVVEDACRPISQEGAEDARERLRLERIRVVKIGDGEEGAEEALGVLAPRTTPPVPPLSGPVGLWWGLNAPGMPAPTAQSLLTPDLTFNASTVLQDTARDAMQEESDEESDGDDTTATSTTPHSRSSLDGFESGVRRVLDDAALDHEVKEGGGDGEGKEGVGGGWGAGGGAVGGERDDGGKGGGLWDRLKGAMKEREATSPFKTPALHHRSSSPSPLLAKVGSARSMTSDISVSTDGRSVGVVISAPTALGCVQAAVMGDVDGFAMVLGRGADPADAPLPLGANAAAACCLSALPWRGDAASVSAEELTWFQELTGAWVPVPSPSPSSSTLHPSPPPSSTSIAPAWRGIACRMERVKGVLGASPIWAPRALHPPACEGLAQPRAVAPAKPALATALDAALAAAVTCGAEPRHAQGVGALGNGAATAAGSSDDSFGDGWKTPAYRTALILSLWHLAAEAQELPPRSPSLLPFTSSSPTPLPPSASASASSPSLTTPPSTSSRPTYASSIRADAWFRTFVRVSTPFTWLSPVEVSLVHCLGLGADAVATDAMAMVASKQKLSLDTLSPSHACRRLCARVATGSAWPQVLQGRSSGVEMLRQLLLEENSWLSQKDATHVAEQVRSFVDTGLASDSPRGGGSSPLLLAAQGDRPLLLSTLLALGADIEAAEHAERLTPLLAACRRGSARCVAVLVAAGARADTTTTFGRNALHMAGAAAAARPLWAERRASLEAEARVQRLALAIARISAAASSTSLAESTHDDGAGDSDSDSSTSSQPKDEWDAVWEAAESVLDPVGMDPSELGLALLGGDGGVGIGGGVGVGVGGAGAGAGAGVGGAKTPFEVGHILWTRAGVDLLELHMAERRVLVYALLRSRAGSEALSRLQRLPMRSRSFHTSTQVAASWIDPSSPILIADPPEGLPDMNIHAERAWAAASASAARRGGGLSAAAAQAVADGAATAAFEDHLLRTLHTISPVIPVMGDGMEDKTARSEVMASASFTRAGAADAVRASASCARLLLTRLPPEGRPTAVGRLLRAADDEGWTPLHFFAKSGALPLIPWASILGAAGLSSADVEEAIGARTRARQATPLHMAVWNKRPLVAHALLHHLPGSTDVAEAVALIAHGATPSALKQAVLASSTPSSSPSSTGATPTSASGNGAPASHSSSRRSRSSTASMPSFRATRAFEFFQFAPDIAAEASAPTTRGSSRRSTVHLSARGLSRSALSRRFSSKTGAAAAGAGLGARNLSKVLLDLLGEGSAEPRASGDGGGGKKDIADKGAGVRGSLGRKESSGRIANVTDATGPPLAMASVPASAVVAAHAAPTQSAPWRRPCRRNAVTSAGHSALDLALMLGDMAMARTLAESDCAPRSATTDQVEVFLHWSVLAGHGESVEALLARAQPTQLSRASLKAAAKAAREMQHPGACTFSWAGYHDPARQVVVECSHPSCGDRKIVCLPCALACHRHGVAPHDAAGASLDATTPLPVPPVAPSEARPRAQFLSSTPQEPSLLPVFAAAGHRRPSRGRKRHTLGLSPLRSPTLMSPGNESHAGSLASTSVTQAGHISTTASRVATVIAESVAVARATDNVAGIAGAAASPAAALRAGRPMTRVSVESVGWDPGDVAPTPRVSSGANNDPPPLSSLPHLRVIGLSITPRHCACPRHSCVCFRAPNPRQQRILSYRPTPMPTDGVEVAILVPSSVRAAAADAIDGTAVDQDLPFVFRTPISPTKKSPKLSSPLPPIRPPSSSSPMLTPPPPPPHTPLGGAFSSSFGRSKRLSTPKKTRHPSTSQSSFGTATAAHILHQTVSSIVCEELARSSHALWGLTRLEQGWRYAATRDNARKLHPLLKPFLSLPREARKYNVQASRESLQLISAMGFVLESPDLSDLLKQVGRDHGGESFPEMVRKALRDAGAALANSRSPALSHRSLGRTPSRVDEEEDGDGEPDPAEQLAIDFTQDLLNTSGVSLSAAEVSLVDMLARNYHEAWAAGQQAKGVVYGDGKPIVRHLVGSAKQTKKKKAKLGKARSKVFRGGKMVDASDRIEIETSPMLVPFDLLTPDAQVDNRQTAEQLVKGLAALGFRLVAPEMRARRIANILSPVLAVVAAKRGGVVDTVGSGTEDGGGGKSLDAARSPSPPTSALATSSPSSRRSPSPRGWEGGGGGEEKKEDDAVDEDVTMGNGEDSTMLMGADANLLEEQLVLLEEEAVGKGKAMLWKGMLFRGSSRGDEWMVRLALKGGTSVIETRNWLGQTSLHMAARGGHSGAVRLLLNEGADINAVDWQDLTPLASAVLERRAETVKMLLGAGAAPRASERHGLTAIHLATLIGDASIVAILAEHLQAELDPDVALRKSGPSSDTANPTSSTSSSSSSSSGVGTSVVTALLLRGGAWGRGRRGSLIDATDGMDKGSPSRLPSTGDEDHPMERESRKHARRSSMTTTHLPRRTDVAAPSPSIRGPESFFWSPLQAYTRAPWAWLSVAVKPTDSLVLEKERKTTASSNSRSRSRKARRRFSDVMSGMGEEDAAALNPSGPLSTHPPSITTSIGVAAWFVLTSTFRTTSLSQYRVRGAAVDALGGTGPGVNHHAAAARARAHVRARMRARSKSGAGGGVLVDVAKELGIEPHIALAFPKSNSFTIRTPRGRWGVRGKAADGVRRTSGWTPGLSLRLASSDFVLQFLARHGSPALLCADQLPAHALRERLTLPPAAIHVLLGKYISRDMEAARAGWFSPSQHTPFAAGRMSPLGLAVSARRGKAALALIRAGADPMAADGTGIAPYLRAIRSLATSAARIAALKDQRSVAIRRASAAAAAARQWRLELYRLGLEQARARRIAARVGMMEEDDEMSSATPDEVVFRMLQAAAERRRQARDAPIVSPTHLQSQHTILAPTHSRPTLASVASTRRLKALLRGASSRARSRSRAHLVPSVSASNLRGGSGGGGGGGGGGGARRGMERSGGARGGAVAVRIAPSDAPSQSRPPTDTSTPTPTPTASSTRQSQREQGRREKGRGGQGCCGAESIVQAKNQERWGPMWWLKHGYQGGVASTVGVYERAIARSRAAAGSVALLEARISREERRADRARALAELMASTAPVQLGRTLFALNEAVVRLLLFVILLLVLSVVTPFAADYPSRAIVRLNDQVNAGLSASLAKVNSSAQLGSWVAGSLLPHPFAPDAGGVPTILAQPSDARGDVGGAAAQVWIPKQSDALTTTTDMTNIQAFVNASRWTQEQAKREAFDAAVRAGWANDGAECVEDPINHVVEEFSYSVRILGKPLLGPIRLVQRRVLPTELLSPVDGEEVEGVIECDAPEALSYGLGACAVRTEEAAAALRSFLIRTTGKKPVKVQEESDGESSIFQEAVSGVTASNGPSLTMTRREIIVSGTAETMGAAVTALLPPPVGYRIGAGTAPLLDEFTWSLDIEFVLYDDIEHISVPILVHSVVQGAAATSMVQPAVRPTNASSHCDTPDFPASSSSSSSWPPPVLPESQLLRNAPWWWPSVGEDEVEAENNSTDTSNLPPQLQRTLNAIPGTAVVVLAVNGMHVFGDRFPPSLAFEIIIGCILLLQVFAMLRRHGYLRWESTGCGRVIVEQESLRHSQSSKRSSVISGSGGDGAKREEGAGKDEDEEEDEEEEEEGLPPPPPPDVDPAALVAAEDSATQTRSANRSSLLWDLYDCALIGLLVGVLVFEVKVRIALIAMEERLEDGVGTGTTWGEGVWMSPSASDAGKTTSFSTLLKYASSGASDGQVDKSQRITSSTFFFDLQSQVNNWFTVLDLLAIFVAMSLIRVSNNLRILPGAGPSLVSVFSTLTSRSVLLFLVLLFFLHAIFGVALHVAVGTHFGRFRTVLRSMTALFQLSLGDVALIDAAPRTPVLVMLLVAQVLVSITLLNLLIAALADSFPSARKASEKQWSQLISEMMARRFAKHAAARELEAYATLGGDEAVAKPQSSTTPSSQSSSPSSASSSNDGDEKGEGVVDDGRARRDQQDARSSVATVAMSVFGPSFGGVEDARWGLGWRPWEFVLLGTTQEVLAKDVELFRQHLRTWEPQLDGNGAEWVDDTEAFETDMPPGAPANAYGDDGGWESDDTVALGALEGEDEDGTFDDEDMEGDDAPLSDVRAVAVTAQSLALLDGSSHAAGPKAVPLPSELRSARDESRGSSSGGGDGGGVDEDDRRVGEEEEEKREARRLHRARAAAQVPWLRARAGRRVLVADPLLWSDRPRTWQARALATAHACDVAERQKGRGLDGLHPDEAPWAADMQPGSMHSRASAAASSSSSTSSSHHPTTSGPSVESDDEDDEDDAFIGGGGHAAPTTEGGGDEGGGGSGGGGGGDEEGGGGRGGGGGGGGGGEGGGEDDGGVAKLKRKKKYGIGFRNADEDEEQEEARREEKLTQLATQGSLTREELLAAARSGPLRA